MHEVSRRVLSVLLQRIEGFVENSDSRTIVIGATNRKQDLDSALLSRFDLSITFPPPSEIERKAIFKIYASHLRDDDLEILASSSSDLTGRDIRDVCTHAEREHASKLILSHEKLNDPSKIEVTAPNLDAYLSALTRRFESIQVHRAP